MRRVVHKQVLNFGMDRQATVELPRHAKVLTLDRQGDYLCIWYEWWPEDPQPEKPVITKTYLLVPTGVEVALTAAFVKTVFFDNRELAFHLYELI